MKSVTPSRVANARTLAVSSSSNRTVDDLRAKVEAWRTLVCRQEQRIGHRIEASRSTISGCRRVFLRESRSLRSRKVEIADRWRRQRITGVQRGQARHAGSRASNRRRRCDARRRAARDRRAAPFHACSRRVPHAEAAGDWIQMRTQQRRHARDRTVRRARSDASDSIAERSAGRWTCTSTRLVGDTSIVGCPALQREAGARSMS